MLVKKYWYFRWFWIIYTWWFYRKTFSKYLFNSLPCNRTPYWLWSIFTVPDKETGSCLDPELPETSPCKEGGEGPGLPYSGEKSQQRWGKHEKKWRRTHPGHEGTAAERTEWEDCCVKATQAGQIIRIAASLAEPKLAYCFVLRERTYK